MSDETVGTTQLTSTPVLLTVPEACSQLHISRWMLYRLIHTRQLTTIKLGRRRLIPQASITDLIERLTQEAA
jgi:excisionase family DNA binding protein